MWHWEVPEIQQVWCQATNDVGAQICRLHPGRFAGMAQLPQHVSTSTANCIVELDRAVNELGFVGAIVNPDPGADGRAPTMTDEYWFPLYERAEELGAVLMIHGSISRDPRWAGVPHGYQVNNVISQYIATVSLESSDIYTRFPQLKTFICHFGGALNRFPREDHEHRYGTFPVANLKFDCVAYDSGFLSLGIQQKGADRILFGSECPGAGTGVVVKDPGRPERAGDDILPVIDSLDFLSDEEKLDIVHNNAVAFFPLLAGVLAE
jgi:predicted TIM-barrel fold metal-dependent hydrolase